MKSPPRSWLSALKSLYKFLYPRKGLMAVGLVLILVNRAATMVLPASSKILIDDIASQRRGEWLLPLALAIAAATLVSAATKLTLAHIFSISSNRAVAEMRVRVQEHLARLPIGYFDRNNTGVLASRVLNDPEGMRELLGTGLLEFAGGMAASVVAAFFMFRINFAMTAFTLLLVICYMAVTTPLIRSLRPLHHERSRLTSALHGELTEILSGIRVVKGFHAERRTSRAFARSALQLVRHTAKVLRSQARLSIGTSVFAGVLTVILVTTGGQSLLRGDMTPGDFLAYLMYLGLLIFPASSFVSTGNQLAGILGRLDRIDELLEETREGDTPRRCNSIGRIRGDISFKNVYFAYEPGKMVLHDISFTAGAGTVTALVGPSGAGKSTVVALVAAFMEPDHGAVLIDNMDLSTVTLDSYRRQLGVVWQDNFLFDGTIRQNIRFGRPGASDAEVESAAKTAYVHEFAEKLDLRYDTLIGERGVRLSGGQRQRIAIARAILASPRILLLDEATSNLDSENEAYIQEALHELIKNRTTIVIAHRLSTIQNASQILVLEQGRIVERGSHSELMRMDGRYRRMRAPQEPATRYARTQ